MSIFKRDYVKSPSGSMSAARAFGSHRPGDALCPVPQMRSDDPIILNQMIGKTLPYRCKGFDVCPPGVTLMSPSILPSDVPGGAHLNKFFTGEEETSSKWQYLISIIFDPATGRRVPSQIPGTAVTAVAQCEFNTCSGYSYGCFYFSE